jgi:uncharacterized protein
MHRDDIIARLKGTEAALRARGVGALYLFGSYARNDARSDFYVDILSIRSLMTRSAF